MSHEITTADFNPTLIHGRASPPETRVNLSRTIIAGLVIIGLTFGGFGTWSAMAPLMSAVVASGSIKVQSNRKKIQHVQGGVVRDILVSDGQSVTAGQVLIRLDDTRARSEVGQLRTKLDTARARAARLNCEKAWCPAIEFPDEMVQRGETSPDIKALIANEQAAFLARRDTVEGEISINNEKIAQLDKQSSGEQAQLNSKKQQINLIRQELAGVEALLAKGLIEKPRVLALQREAARLDGEIGQHVAEMARVATQVSESKLRIVQVRRTFQESVVNDLKEVENQIPETENKLAEARHILDEIEIKAPADGVVVGLDVHTKGGVIAPGQSVMEIVPASDRLMVEARVPVRDVENLRVGQTSHVRITAFKQRTTPAIQGSLAYISADSLTDDKTQQSYYLVRVEVTDDAVKEAGVPPLQPGMPAEVMVATGERTVLQYLSQPLLDGMNRAWREK